MGKYRGKLTSRQLDSQAVDDPPKQLKACAEAWHKHRECKV